MDHQKPTILLIFGTLSLGGCGGHPMRPKLNLKDKSQMSTPNEYTDNLKSNLICIFLSVRTKSKKPLCPRTQCIWGYCFRVYEEVWFSGCGGLLVCRVFVFWLYSSFWPSLFLFDFPRVFVLCRGVLLFGCRLIRPRF